MRLGIHALVSGVVQGVFFRAETQAQAQSLGITGWVRNLPSGEVELQAYGAEAALQSLIAWLNEGPPAAKVEKVEVTKIDFLVCERFEVRSTPNN